MRLPTRSLKNQQSGFTLIELAVVIGVLAVLLGIVLVAINPARQFSQANNTQRRSDVNAILNAIHQYAADNNGTLPTGIPVAPAAAGVISNTAVNICSALVPTYIAALPYDPTTTGAGFTDCTTYNTGYTVVQNAANRVTVTAPDTEVPETTDITVTR